MKEYTEYEDRLINKETADLANKIGFNVYCPECFILNEGGIILDAWTGLIEEQSKFLYYRPTQSSLQKWLRNEHKIHIELRISSFTSKYYILLLKNYLPILINVKQQFKTYEEALEEGLNQSLKIIK